jgi:drug/metabolite transporter (DMT)-like permease
MNLRKQKSKDIKPRRRKSMKAMVSNNSEKQSDGQINYQMNLKEWGLLLFLSLIWGGSFFFVEVAVKEITPLTLVLGRVGLASLFLLLFLHFKGLRMPGISKIWGSFLIMGILNNIIPFSLIAWGQTHIQSSLASILNATTPIFTVIMAHLLTTDEKLTFHRGLGVLIGWAGVTVLIGIEALKVWDLQIIGQIAILGAAISYACAGIFGRRFKEINSTVVATGMLIGSTVVMIPMVFIFESPLNLAPNFITLGAMIGLSLISTSVAYIVYFRLLASAGATNLLLVTFLIPVSAIFLGVLVLGEQLKWDDFGGMSLIFMGLIAIDGRVFKLFKKKIE